MARYAKDGEDLLLHLTPDDLGLLDSLVSQFSDLLAEGAPAVAHSVDDDPLTRLEAELAAPDEIVDEEDNPDPALRRLFPNPYPHDPQAASDYRRFTESDHRRRKLEDAQLVARALHAKKPVRIRPAEQGAWLKTLNALRLVLASRLGIDDVESMEQMQALADDDPRAMMGAVMDWLAYLQGVVIELASPLDEPDDPEDPEDEGDR